jgi:hypothetical protein
MRQKCGGAKLGDETAPNRSAPEPGFVVLDFGRVSVRRSTTDCDTWGEGVRVGRYAYCDVFTHQTPRNNFTMLLGV